MDLENVTSKPSPTVFWNLKSQNALISRTISWGRDTQKHKHTHHAARALEQARESEYCFKTEQKKARVAAAHAGGVLLWHPRVCHAAAAAAALSR
jgi:hypothetical protein